MTSRPTVSPFQDWCLRNPEKRREQRKREYAAAMARDPEGTRRKAAERMRAWTARNPEKVAERNRKWAAANQGHVKALAKARYANDPEAAKQWRDLRRARIKGGSVDGPVDRQAIIARDGGRCHLCGGYPTGLDLTLDHVVPLARGGAHTEANLRVACRSCNSRKAASVPGP